MTNKNVQIALGVTALIALLAYTFVHTGGLLSRYVDPPLIGYVCAFGIELAIVSLSIRIGELRQDSDRTQSHSFFYFVLVSVVVVSALANVSEGFFTRQGQELTLSTMFSLDPVQIVIGLTATGLISLIVLALSEIVGGDVSTVQTGEQHGFTLTISAPGNVQISERQQLLIETVREHPQLSVSKVAERVGVSRTTVYNEVDALRQVGLLDKNGDGWVVREVEQIDAPR